MSMASAKPAGPPRIRQLSVFIENRTLELASITRALEPENVRIYAISILSAADHAVARLVVDRPAVAQLVLEAQGLRVFRTELLGVALSSTDEPEFGIGRVLGALLAAEVRVEYVYALITSLEGRPVVALHVDDLEIASRALTGAGLSLVDQEQLGWGP